MYFVTSDIHSYFTIFKKALNESGFDIKNPEHKLIICGDLFDRGSEAKELLKFLLSIPKERLILIRGNHEDLFDECLEQLEQRVNISSYHWSNGTVDTIAQLCNLNKYDLICGVYNYEKDIKSKLKKYYKLINNCLNYYELNNYIFVHGWIPQVRSYENVLKCNDDCWKVARWSNGMEWWYNGWKLKDKTIVCGHWHTSFANYKYHHRGSGEFEKDSDFGIFKDSGIIALDACTAFSHKCNILTLDI